MNPITMHYINVFSSFNIKWDTYDELKKEDNPDVLVNNDKENDCKIIIWVSNFTESLYQTDGSRGTLVYVLQESSDVPSEVDDPLEANSYP